MGAHVVTNQDGGVLGWYAILQPVPNQPMLNLRHEAVPGVSRLELPFCMVIRDLGRLGRPWMGARPFSFPDGLHHDELTRHGGDGGGRTLPFVCSPVDVNLFALASNKVRSPYSWCVLERCLICKEGREARTYGRKE